MSELTEVNTIKKIVYFKTIIVSFLLKKNNESYSMIISRNHNIQYFDDNSYNEFIFYVMYSFICA